MGRLTRPIIPLVMKSAGAYAGAECAMWRGMEIGSAPRGWSRSLTTASDAPLPTKLFRPTKSRSPHWTALPCPITIAWPEKDARAFPVGRYEKAARPSAYRTRPFTILPDVGHAPMLDDPEHGGAHHPRRHRCSEELVLNGTESGNSAWVLGTANVP